MESRWRAQAERSSSLRGFLPAVRSEKWNEAARLKHGGAKAIMAALDQLQILIFHIAHRHNHSSAFGKLRKERCRHGRRRRSHENGVVRSELRQTLRSAAAMHVSILTAKARQPRGSFSGHDLPKPPGQDLARPAGPPACLRANPRT